MGLSVLHLHQQAKLLQVRYVWSFERDVHQAGEVRCGSKQTGTSATPTDRGGH